MVDSRDGGCFRRPRRALFCLSASTAHWVSCVALAAAICRDAPRVSPRVGNRHSVDDAFRLAVAHVHNVPLCGGPRGCRLACLRCPSEGDACGNGCTIGADDGVAALARRGDFQPVGAGGDIVFDLQYTCHIVARRHCHAELSIGASAARLQSGSRDAGRHR